jgi:hypothetical protein
MAELLLTGKKIQSQKINLVTISTAYIQHKSTYVCNILDFLLQKKGVSTSESGTSCAVTLKQSFFNLSFVFVLFFLPMRDQQYYLTRLYVKNYLGAQNSE